jgi:dihydropteroate synthase
MKGIDPVQDGLRLGKYTLPLKKRTLIMGILNVTPDSFSDGGRFYAPEKALQQAERLLQEGADIIDVGGESTRPGHVPVSVEEELARIIPVIEALAKRLDAPVSVDTYKAAVAEEALQAGAHMVNDIWRLLGDPRMAEVTARYGVPICLMHNRRVNQYRDLMADILADLRESIDMALGAGIRPENILVDPGIGFAKDPAQNLDVMRDLEALKTLGYPILLGTSRKSMIGKVLDVPMTERVEGTAATVAFGIVKGADIVRVHDVLAMTRVARMTDAMLKGGEALAGR